MKKIITTLFICLVGFVLTTIVINQNVKKETVNVPIQYDRHTPSNMKLGGTGTITIDATTSTSSIGYVATKTQGTSTMTISASANLLVVSVGVFQDVAGVGTVSGIKCGSSALTKASSTRASGTTMSDEIWYLTSPPSGSQKIEISITGTTDGWRAGSVSLIGANASPLDQIKSSGGSGTSASTSITPSDNNQIIIDDLITYGGTAPVPGQTKIYSRTGTILTGMQYYIQTTAAAKSMTWSWTTSGDYSHLVTSWKSADSATSAVTPPEFFTFQ